MRSRLLRRLPSVRRATYVAAPGSEALDDLSLMELLLGGFGPDAAACLTAFHLDGEGSPSPNGLCMIMKKCTALEELSAALPSLPGPTGMPRRPWYPGHARQRPRWWRTAEDVAAAAGGDAEGAPLAVTRPDPGCTSRGLQAGGLGGHWEEEQDGEEEDAQAGGGNALVHSGKARDEAAAATAGGQGGRQGAGVAAAQPASPSPSYHADVAIDGAAGAGGGGGAPAAAAAIEGWNDGGLDLYGSNWMGGGGGVDGDDGGGWDDDDSSGGGGDDGGGSGGGGGGGGGAPRPRFELPWEQDGVGAGAGVGGLAEGGQAGAGGGGGGEEGEDGWGVGGSGAGCGDPWAHSAAARRIAAQRDRTAAMLGAVMGAYGGAAAGWGAGGHGWGADADGGGGGGADAVGAGDDGEPCAVLLVLREPSTDPAVPRGAHDDGTNAAWHLGPVPSGASGTRHPQQQPAPPDDAVAVAGTGPGRAAGSGTGGGGGGGGVAAGVDVGRLYPHLPGLESKEQEEVAEVMNALPVSLTSLTLRDPWLVLEPVALAPLGRLQRLRSLELRGAERVCGRDPWGTQVRVAGAWGPGSGGGGRTASCSRRVGR